MASEAVLRSLPRELDRRVAGSLEVTLFWLPDSQSVRVRMRDRMACKRLELEVEPGEALDAFRHPYAYAARASRPAPRLSAGC